ncbi:hypothetical protein BOTBODRAFT_499451 [Botryobasidium botryosum FD-172 SS1]|uniref:Uncharacterized protein n=1 Tax=Botryobasidium botryosum (strain FD-172 SS1) TaxID=930990 RepID=A0A067MF27_BOTB1|nr:hypothetical protein BOTBODRAFT_499451 [Botryobasidium botryosum FD-172 SS1]
MLYHACVIHSSSRTSHLARPISGSLSHLGLGCGLVLGGRSLGWSLLHHLYLPWPWTRARKLSKLGSMSADMNVHIIRGRVSAAIHSRGPTTT